MILSINCISLSALTHACTKISLTNSCRWIQEDNNIPNTTKHNWACKESPMLLSLKIKQFYFAICIEGSACMVHVTDIRNWYMFRGAVKCRSLITWRDTISVKQFKIITVCGLSSQNIYMFSMWIWTLFTTGKFGGFFRMFNNINFRKAIGLNIHNGHQNMLTELSGWKFSFKIFFICLHICETSNKNWFYANCKLSLKTVL